MISSASKELDRALDAVAENATEQLTLQQNQHAVRSHLATAITLCVVVPAFAVGLQVIRLLLGLPSGTWFSGLWLSLLALLVPMIWLIQKTLRHPATINRQGALQAMDRSLGSSDRIVTADQFVRSKNQNGFMQAAIEDAQEWVQRASNAQLAEAEAVVVDPKKPLAAVTAAVAVMVVAAWLASLGDAAESVSMAETPRQQVSSVETELADSESSSVPTKLETEPERQEDAAADRPDPTASRSGATPTEVPSEKDDSQGKLTDGETNESQQSSAPSNARGEPSSHGQPTKEQAKTEKKSNKTKPKKDGAEPKKEPPNAEEPSGVTAGQGSSRGSSKNAASSEWSSRSQAATPDDEQNQEDEEVDDEDEEQKARGGVQPNMRDRRPPVNRDLQIGFGNRSDPDANGRGGPSAQKKSRGVASLVLGVPIPDRINGQPNKGRTRVTQQRINPAAEEATPVAAQARGERAGEVGPIHHPKMRPWLQNLVRRYFLQRREQSKTTGE